MAEQDIISAGDGDGDKPGGRLWQAPHQEEMRLLIKDLEEAKTTLFVRTAEAKPMIERCWNAVEALKAAQPGSQEAEDAFGDFEGAVSKLRNTILVRTQRATLRTRVLYANQKIGLDRSTIDNHRLWQLGAGRG